MCRHVGPSSVVFGYNIPRLLLAHLHTPQALQQPRSVDWKSLDVFKLLLFGPRWTAAQWNKSFSHSGRKNNAQRVNISF